MKKNWHASDDAMTVGGQFKLFESFHGEFVKRIYGNKGSVILMHIIHIFDGFYWILAKSIKFYWNLLDSIGIYQILSKNLQRNLLTNFYICFYTFIYTALVIIAFGTNTW